MHQRAYIAESKPVIPTALAAFKPPQLANTRRGASTGKEYWASDLHYLAAFHDGPSRSHLYGNPKVMELGIVPFVAAAATAYNAYNQSKSGGASQGGGGGPSQGGPTTGMQQPGSASATTVSPTIQTEISPQISPVFSQMQDSAGATQAATTTQYKPGGMSAEGGSATAQPALPGMPGSQPLYSPPSPSYFSGPQKGGGLNYSPIDPRTLSNLPTAGKMIADIQESRPFNWTPVYVIGGLGIAGALALAFMKQRKGR